MPEIRSKMFKESEKSSVSDSLVTNIFSFILILAVILVAETIIPWLMTKEIINERIAEFGNSGARLTMKVIRSIASAVTSDSKAYIATLLCTVFGTLISIIYCRFGEARPLRSMGITKHRAGLHYLQGLGVGLLVSSVMLVTVLFRVNSITFCKGANYVTILLMMLGFGIQGMSEEFVFRGFLMNTLGGRHHPFVAIGVSAAAFSLSHILNPGFGLLAFINIAMFGVFASLYMILFDDIWGACAIHSAWNFLQGSVYGMKVSGSETTESVFRTVPAISSRLLTGGEFGIEGSIFTTVVFAAGIVVLWLMITKKAEKTSADTQG